MRLLGVELDRFFSRRAMRWLILATLLVAGSAGLIAMDSARPPSAEYRAQVQQEFDQHYQYWLETHEEDRATCLEEQAAAQESEPGVDYGCEYWNEEPRLSDWLSEPDFASSAPWILAGTFTGLLMIGLVTAVSFVSAEFSTGSVSSWLTFEPRRARVYLSKLGAGTIGVLVMTLLGLAIGLAAVVVPFVAFGTYETMSTEQWTTLARTGGRVVLAALIVAVLGTALAMLVRHLAAALGIVIGWLLIVEQLLVAGLPALQPWTLGLSMQALINDYAIYYRDVCTLTPEGRSCEWTDFSIHSMQGGLVLGGVAVVATILALLVFRRRDVN